MQWMPQKVQVWRLLSEAAFLRKKCRIICLYWAPQATLHPSRQAVGLTGKHSKLDNELLISVLIKELKAKTRLNPKDHQELTVYQITFKFKYTFHLCPSEKSPIFEIKTNEHIPKVVGIIYCIRTYSHKTANHVSSKRQQKDMIFHRNSLLFQQLKYSRQWSLSEKEFLSLSSFKQVGIQEWQGIYLFLSRFILWLDMNIYTFRFHYSHRQPKRNNFSF